MTRSSPSLSTTPTLEPRRLILIAGSGLLLMAFLFFWPELPQAAAQVTDLVHW